MTGEEIHTESVQSSTDDHEYITLGSIECGPIFLCELIRTNEHSQSAYTDPDSLYHKTISPKQFDFLESTMLHIRAIESNGISDAYTPSRRTSKLG